MQHKVRICWVSKFLGISVVQCPLGVRCMYVAQWVLNVGSDSPSGRSVEFEVFGCSDACSTTEWTEASMIQNAALSYRHDSSWKTNEQIYVTQVTPPRDGSSGIVVMDTGGQD
ncbi:hypothetical protein PAXRUDRAFT_664714 [Paxillus rubicundulus Ve08.2h10]|uniref:Uncharacterized protein n=1 Tax=Paxillus rubicundulus Ve08.2h10 TaxID=930991 RepID=A0A0D0EC20_9AGAM|nr:hypothetical protein PAXRUDRAFT_664714 [Paxillus rubicundulus Ve08.2h10]